MSLFHAVILGLIEGITEFLPISSTGHMTLASTLLQIPQTEFVKTFEIIIQLGAVFAILWMYRSSLFVKRKTMGRLLVAFIPTAIVGFVVYKIVKEYLLGNVQVTIAALFIGGIVFLLLERFLHKEKQIVNIEDVSFQQAILIGLGQTISMIPGVSRAAATMFAGMVVGLSRPVAIEFSFLLAVPTMFAASILDLLKSKPTITIDFSLPLAVGFITAFISAFLVVKTFVKFAQKHSFVPFGIYRIILALTFWLFILK